LICLTVVFDFFKDFLNFTLTLFLYFFLQLISNQSQEAEREIREREGSEREGSEREGSEREGSEREIRDRGQRDQRSEIRDKRSERDRETERDREGKRKKEKKPEERPKQREPWKRKGQRSKQAWQALATPWAAPAIPFLLWKFPGATVAGEARVGLAFPLFGRVAGRRLEAGEEGWRQPSQTLRGLGWGLPKRAWGGSGVWL